MSDVAALEVRDLHKYFGTHEVLKGIDMTAHKGDVNLPYRLLRLGEVDLSSLYQSARNPLIRHRLAPWRVDPDENQPRRRAVARGYASGGADPQPTGHGVSKFQSLSHMTIMQNIIEVPIQVLKVPRAEALAKAEQLLNRVGSGSGVTTIPATSLVVSSSGPPLPVRWR